MRVITPEYLEEKETRAVAARVRHERVGHSVARLLVLAAFVGIWQGLSARYDVTLLPSPLQTYAGLTRGWNVISIGAADTVTEIAVGFAIGAASGLILGALIGQSKIVQGVLHPYLILYQAIPKSGLAPMIILLLGFGMMPKITLAAMSTVLPVLENTILGVQRVDEDSLRLFRGLGANAADSVQALAHQRPALHHDGGQSRRRARHRARSSWRSSLRVASAWEP